MKFNGDIHNVEKLIKDKEFWHRYLQIIATLGFSEAEDKEARDLLFNSFSEKSEYILENKIGLIQDIIKNKKIIYIFGGGPGTNVFLNNVTRAFCNKRFQKLFENKHLIIAIDGSTEVLVNHNIIPDIIFTDLDGITLNKAQKKELEHTFFVIHAHGDNQNKIREFRNFIINHDDILGSTQVESRYPILNYGGFTDGDRALYFLNNFIDSSYKVYLIGYEFGNIVGKHSKPEYIDNIKASAIKLKKLDIGKELVESIILSSKASFKCIDMGFPIELKCEIISSNQMEF